MLADELQADLTAAMKARDELTVSVLRMAVAAVRQAAVAGDAAHDLSDDEVRAAIAREAKRRDEAAASYRDAGRDDRAARELAEREVLARYLPAPMGDDELAALVDAALADGDFTAPSDMGAAMKAAMARVGDGADGKAVSALVRARLST